MIAAYRTVNAAVCAKCNRLHDSLGQGPVARRSTETSNGDEPPTLIWEALHPSCADRYQKKGSKIGSHSWGRSEYHSPSLFL